MKIFTPRPVESSALIEMLSPLGVVPILTDDGNETLVHVTMKAALTHLVKQGRSIPEEDIALFIKAGVAESLEDIVTTIQTKNFHAGDHDYQFACAVDAIARYQHLYGMLIHGSEILRPVVTCLVDVLASLIAECRERPVSAADLYQALKNAHEAGLPMKTTAPELLSFASGTLHVNLALPYADELIVAAQELGVQCHVTWSDEGMPLIGEMPSA